MEVKDIIKQEIGLYHLCEDVRTFNQKNWNTHKLEKPIKEGDKLRVYHGFAAIKDALLASKYGLSGDKVVPRRYSYERVNNPKGLFVTTDFNAAKEFTSYPPNVIVEFNTLYKHLESPTWVGGRGYFVQGEYTSGFESDDERKQQMMQNREKASQFDDPRIAQSDRPEVAEMLFGSESQALFIGHLNPNMIKYFWVKEENNINKEFDRYTREEFIKKYYKDEYTHSTYNTSKGSEKRMSDEEHDLKSKIFSPNDNFNIYKVVKYVQDRYPDAIEYIKNITHNKKDETGKDFLLHILHPKQITQLKQKFNVSDEVLSNYTGFNK